MSSTKRISGNYTIASINKTATNADPNAARITFDTNIVDITGDLRVSGEATFIQKQDVSISDNIIVLNDGETGAGISTDFSGIEINRGTLPKADLLYDDINDQWTVDQGDGVRRTILTTTASQGNPLYNVVEDLTPQLGGDLDVNGFQILALSGNNVVLTTSGGGLITANGPLSIRGIAPTNAVQASEVVLYKGADNGGGTQLHFENDTGTDELVSKRKALAFSIIF